MRVARQDIRSHPIIGQHVDNISINTRTFVVWALDIDFNIDNIWKNVRVLKKQQALTTDTAVIRMMSYNGEKKGFLRKRQHSKPFKSVLSLDVQFKNKMPNVKVSRKNTLQVTGVCSIQLLMELLASFVSQYSGQGITAGQHAGFVADIVLSNVYFRLPATLNRHRVSKAVQDSGQYVVSFEEVTRDASISIRNYKRQLPNNGDIYSLWYTDASEINMIDQKKLETLRPNLTRRTQFDVHTFRVFKSGSVVHIGRWPLSMAIEKDHIIRLITRCIGHCLRQTCIQKYLTKQ